ncbi:hypothetical protein [Streptomyces aureocirculatus]|uniref:hypothetical protein n=1 Tax=Streptomyces aureocirculatus TaxID=67275 RepID=UPI0004C4E9F5|nr:hypothetical protein [Streptomyces aureocirculatus]
MNSTDETKPTTTAEDLLAWKSSELDAIAVRMLVEEHEILDRPAFQRVTVVQADNGVHADWVHLSPCLDKLVHDEDQEERQFLEIVLAIALGRQILLDCVRQLGERRLAIVLRALVAWAGVDSIAVGTRS